MSNGECALGEPGPAPRFDEEPSRTFEVFGVDVRAASLEDILRSKQASSRPQDRQDALVLREMLERGEH